MKQDTESSTARCAESLRLAEDERRDKNWKRWGPYLAERQWGTVREDYSADGSVWGYFPHEHARSRAYRWGEDGLLGFTDRECRLCLALALWNGKDSILKERLFGLSGEEGNHGEDCKECYYYLDSTPTHSYVKSLYKYPQAEFPYARLLMENEGRSRSEPEFELTDTGIFDGSKYFDVFAEYAKAGPDDILLRVSVHNRANERALLHLLPTLWFRNTWSWGCPQEDAAERPSLRAWGDHSIRTEHQTLGRFVLTAERGPGGTAPARLFTDNDTDTAGLFAAAAAPAHVKNAFHRYVVQGDRGAVNPAGVGTKGAFHYVLDLAARSNFVLRLRLRPDTVGAGDGFGDFDEILATRAREADAFYAARAGTALKGPDREVVRQACAGLFTSKQFYHYIVADWLNGDPDQPPPPEQRKYGRNADWVDLYNRDVISMPDKWEYPWYAAWDLAFHAVAIAKVDPVFAKEQLLLFLREWYMHPSGQIPAYEFALGDVNPPVHAWACWRVYKMTGARGVHAEGGRDRAFLARAFQKLLLNFTWWVNRKDVNGRHIFAGGFLGLDNIGVFDRSRPLPTGGRLDQADGTAWMAFYCGTMLAMALELALEDPVYEDLASKFFEHFVSITDAMNSLGGTGLWDEPDGFYYDQLMLNGNVTPLKVRSLVGLIPLLAVEVLRQDHIDRLPGFKKRMEWFLKHRQDLARHIAYMEPGPERGRSGHAQRLLAIPSRDRLERTLRYLLDESEFLSPFGIRSVSKFHKDHPFVLRSDHGPGVEQEHRVDYVPGDSDTALFGGNSNWRGPVWFPLNFLLIEALERYHHFYGDSLRVEFPTGSGVRVTLQDAANRLRRRLAVIFLPDADGRRPFHGDDALYTADPSNKSLLLFHEYFHAETGKGLGASHQTGWTALIALIILDLAVADRAR